MGGIALQNRDYEAAIAIFRDLARKSPSPRIRLELARALFLGTYFEESRQLFEEVRDAEGTPWSVRQNIELYLDELDIKLGFVKFDIALVSDSNPRNFTSDRRILIAGQVLTIVPPDDNKEVRGIRYHVESGRALSANQRLQGYLDLSFTDYEQSQFDRGVADLRLIYDPEAFPRLKARTGIELSTVNGDKEYDYPYLSLIYLADPVDRYRILYEIKAAHLNIPGAGHLDANQYIAAAGLTRRLEGFALLKANVAAERSEAREKPYSYNGASMGLAADFSLGTWGMEPFIAFSKRFYRDIDPFFGTTRYDFRKRAGLVLSSRKLRLGSFTPEIGLTYDKNDSSIGFYSYDKLSLFFRIIE
ncbi:MAG: DUF560 domain-containing protein [Oceanospirillaceae bacterium]|nr:DUF560 domain-containing protein [Oceanospirillaceae bacterium]